MGSAGTALRRLTAEPLWAPHLRRMVREGSRMPGIVGRQCELEALRRFAERLPEGPAALTVQGERRSISAAGVTLGPP